MDLPELHEHETTEDNVEQIASEEEDRDYSPPSYDIITYPADYTLEGLVSKLRNNQIRAAGFQRKYVWKLPQASRLIESFLLGLPVPAVFLYTQPSDNSLLVIDGQQRLMTIKFFFEGYFISPSAQNRTVFALKGLSSASPYRDKTYSDLRDQNKAAYNKLNDAVLRAFIVKQLQPNDDTSVYHIFQRLNTGGTPLDSQEIRNCIYHGALNERLSQLNQLSTWRRIFGKTGEDPRQRDIELILRFLSLFYSLETYEKPMTDFLSRFMNRYRNVSAEKLDEMADLFENTTNTVLGALGDKPFHIHTGLNAAVFDSTYVAIARNMAQAQQGSLAQRYHALLQDDEYKKNVSSSTTDVDVVRRRIAKAERAVQSTD